jgi:hypothetical protein
MNIIRIKKCQKWYWKMNVCSNFQKYFFENDQHPSLKIVWKYKYKPTLFKNEGYVSTSYRLQMEMDFLDPPILSLDIYLIFKHLYFQIQIASWPSL